MSNGFKALHHPDGHPHGTGVWTPFKKASEWTRKEIPCRPGLYNVIAIDAAGKPRVWPPRTGLDTHATKQATRALRDGFGGVIYVGKARNLKRRFWQLIRSWQDAAKLPSDPHNSRETWDALDALTKADFPFDRMSFRYKTVSATDWKTMQDAAKEGGPAAWLAGIPEDGPALGQNKNFPPTEHLAINEYQEISRFCRYRGPLPTLNKIAGATPGELPDQAWWLSNHSEQDRMTKELESLFGADGASDPDTTDDDDGLD